MFNTMYASPISNITPAMVSVAMSRSDSRDSNFSSTSSVLDATSHFTSAPMTVSYSTSPISYMTRTTSDTSSYFTSRRASSTLMRRESSSSSSGWTPSPYRSCQLRSCDESTSYLSDDDLLYIAPPTTSPQPLSELPIEYIPNPQRELTTEEQIAMLRETQERDQEQELLHLQQQRRQAAAAAQKAVRFVEHKPRRPSALKRKSTTVKKGTSQMSQ